MKSKTIILTVVAALLLSACGTTSTVPVTGRKQRISVSDDAILTQSFNEYNQYMSKVKKSTDAANTQMVQRVGQRLANAVETYLNQNGYSNLVKNYKWEFNLVQDNSANAFCMPGGKIVVYEGLLPYTKNETALAIVLGHEIAHAVARHSQEQLSKQQTQQTILGIAGAALGAAGVNTNGVSSWANLGLNVLNCKYSRANESEADHMGLIFAAMAGYNPDEAVPFWERMASGSNSNSIALFSDHPSDAQRIADIKGWLPEAEKYYKAATPAVTTTTAAKTTTAKKSTTATKKKTATSTKKRTTRKRR